MSYNLEHFSDRLRQARIAKNLSQRELSKLAGVPQSHISRIESNQVDLRISSLIAIVNALDLEVALIPRKAMPAVRSIVRQVASNTSIQRSASEAKPAYTLDEDDQ
ncbi:helix-turn-helix domain-containing protein [Paenalcaligenes niemegkensis]|uniref:helix-turn-helix domain-containing protein n=1 Tax=Paenalcaligenes niemegkensis TaxID=2895469 RepID=UPI001EE80375|nr:helix-turn-helix transcriptional regulator [Paenalcaligenes niemegkensis]MCQ9618003.1 helix-turn-helix domain-containing protein [Paenalcaligenes niemegkensis]